MEARQSWGGQCSLALCLARYLGSCRLGLHSLAGPCRTQAGWQSPGSAEWPIRVLQVLLGKPWAGLPGSVRASCPPRQAASGATPADSQAPAAPAPCQPAHPEFTVLRPQHQSNAYAAGEDLVMAAETPSANYSLSLNLCSMTHYAWTYTCSPGEKDESQLFCQMA